jgi:hypothetical protein
MFIDIKKTKSNTISVDPKCHVITITVHRCIEHAIHHRENDIEKLNQRSRTRKYLAHFTDNIYYA